MSIFSDFFAPYGETEILGRSYELWSDKFYLGTDNLGRDMLSRLIYGGRNTIALALIITVLAFIIGGLGGMIAGVVGGWTDQILSRIVDILMAIPALIFSLLVLSIFGTSLGNLIGVIALLDSTIREGEQSPNVSFSICLLYTSDAADE